MQMIFVSRRIFNMDLGENHHVHVTLFRKRKKSTNFELILNRDFMIATFILFVFTLATFFRMGFFVLKIKSFTVETSLYPGLPASHSALSIGQHIVGLWLPL